MSPPRNDISKYVSLKQLASGDDTNNKLKVLKKREKVNAKEKRMSTEVRRFVKKSRLGAGGSTNDLLSKFKAKRVLNSENEVPELNVSLIRHTETPSYLHVKHSTPVKMQTSERRNIPVVESPPRPPSGHKVFDFKEEFSKVFQARQQMNAEVVTVPLQQEFETFGDAYLEKNSAYYLLNRH